MPFKGPSDWPALPDIPDSISLERFMFDENYGRFPLGYSKAPFTDALSGRAYTALDLKDRVEHLSRALCKEFGFKPNEGSEFDKVVAVFSLNCVDYMTLAWALHRIGGILTCVNAAYNASELEYQLKDSGAKAIFTCLPLLQTCKDGVKKAGLAQDKIYLLPLAEQVTQGLSPEGFASIEQLIQTGSRLGHVPRSDENWSKGEASRRAAFLCYSSGTSGLPKGVVISHANVMANTIQLTTAESELRDQLAQREKINNYTENVLGLLPMSHIYGLVVIAHLGVYRGDGIVVLPRYELQLLLQSVQRFKIEMLYLVPPIIIQITNSKDVVKQYDLSSVRSTFTGAAPLGEETAQALQSMFPSWNIQQGYGLTETSTVVSFTPTTDIVFGSSGVLLPGIECRLVTVEGNEISGYDQPGELWVKSPAVVIGYLNNDKANKETFIDEKDGRYMRTGDEAVFKKGPHGTDHLFIVDRIKELIKVKGHQVAPAELEAHLLTHPSVQDCVVIGIPSDREGEVPKAFVVKDPGSKESDDSLKQSVEKYVRDHKSNAKWLRGGVEIIEVVPKSPSGKILRRLMRDREKEKMKKAGAKL